MTIVRTLRKVYKTIFRSSVTGRIVKASYARSHPKTTEKQMVSYVIRKYE